MDLASFNGFIGTVELGISFLKNRGPHFFTIVTTSSEGRNLISVSITSHGDPVINNDMLKLTILMESDHEASRVFPIVFTIWIVAFLLANPILAFLASEKVDGTVVSKHAQSG